MTVNVKKDRNSFVGSKLVNPDGTLMIKDIDISLPKVIVGMLKVPVLLVVR